MLNLLPKMQQQLDTSSIYAVNATFLLMYLLVLVKNTNTSAKSQNAFMLSGEVANTSDIEIRYNVERAIRTMMVVTAPSKYEGTVLTFFYQRINLQLVTYHMFFVSKRANSYVESTAYSLCIINETILI